MEESIRSLSNGMAFENDEDVIGKWEFFDIIQSEDDFDDGRAKSVYSGKRFKEIYFLPNGQGYWIFEGWTKGFLLTHNGGDEPVICNEYKLCSADGQTYMFLKENADSASESASFIHVLRKTSNRKFTLWEIGIHDCIDLPFVLDEKVLGSWRSIDFVQNISDFDINRSKFPALWLKAISFINNGTAVREYGDETWYDHWTKGALIDNRKATASAYRIEIMSNKEILFLEWKMGNYVYGGAMPDYYVFERLNK